MEHSEEKYKNAQETLNKVKSEKKEALTKIKAMQQELDKNNEEISSIKKTLEMLDKLYNEAKSKHSSDLEVLDTTQRELNDLKNEKIKYGHHNILYNIRADFIVINLQAGTGITKENGRMAV